MDRRELKMVMRSKARLARGLSYLLKDDADQIYSDIDSLDVVSLEEAVRDIRRTTQQLTEAITDLDYYLYLVKNDDAATDA